MFELFLARRIQRVRKFTGFMTLIFFFASFFSFLALVYNKINARSMFLSMFELHSWRSNIGECYKNWDGGQRHIESICQKKVDFDFGFLRQSSFVYFVMRYDFTVEFLYQKYVCVNVRTVFQRGGTSSIKTKTRFMNFDFGLLLCFLFFLFV